MSKPTWHFAVCLALLPVFTCGGGRSGGGLPTTDDVIIPEQCVLDEDIEVTELSFRGVDSGLIELDEGEERNIRVWAELDEPSSGPSVVCFVVRDVQVGPAPPIASGFTIVRAGQRVPNQAIEAFAVACENGEIVGRSTLSASLGGDEVDASTNERSTRIFIQHTEDVRTFLGTDVVTGLQGERSERIRVRCRR
jgi:hypothetical protein